MDDEPIVLFSDDGSRGMAQELERIATALENNEGNPQRLVPEAAAIVGRLDPGNAQAMEGHISRFVMRGKGLDALTGWIRGAATSARLGGIAPSRTPTTVVNQSTDVRASAVVTLNHVADTIRSVAASFEDADLVAKANSLADEVSATADRQHATERIREFIRDAAASAELGQFLAMVIASM